jgi:predicted branched-subunit amino acid permease
VQEVDISAHLGEKQPIETPWPHVWHGVQQAFGIPSLVLMASLIGVGGLCRDIGYPVGVAVLSTLLIWAAPGQVVFFGSLAAGASLPATALAISLSSVRFLPMCVALLPLMRTKKTPIWVLMGLSHYVAITAWVEGMRRLPDMPQAARIPYFLGFANTVMLAATFATGLGYYLISALPPVFAAGLLFTSPMFFTCSMIASARHLLDWLALGLGFALAPIIFLYAPDGSDLLIQGLGVGTLAYFLNKLIQKARHSDER